MTVVPSFAAFVQRFVIEKSQRTRQIPTDTLIEQGERAAMRAVRSGLCEKAPRDWWIE